MTETTIAEDKEEMLTVKEVADELRVRKQTIYNYISEGILDAIRIGFNDKAEKSRRHWRIPKSAFEAFKEKGKVRHSTDEAGQTEPER